MKILIAHNFYQQRAGEDAVVQEEARLLSSFGEEVSLFSVHNDHIQGFWTKVWTGLNTVYNIPAQIRIAADIRQKRPDIVHVHNFFPQLSPSIFYACKNEGVPCVLTLHNFRILCPTCFLYSDEKIRERSLHAPCWWTVPRKVYRNSFAGTLVLSTMVELHKRIGTWCNNVDCFIALTAFAKGKFVEGGLPAERIAVKGNSVAEPPFIYSDGNRNGALFVGRLSEEKGVITLLDAWKDLNYPLTIIGTGPLVKHVQSYASDNIRVVGHLPRDEVFKEMTKARFLVLPSLWYEMFPVVAIEAFACRLPIIASNLGSLRELIGEFETGLNFQVGSHRDLAKKVYWAISHTNEMRQFGLNARRKYENEFSPSISYRKLMDIYQNVLTGPLHGNDGHA